MSDVALCSQVCPKNVLFDSRHYLLLFHSSGIHHDEHGCHGIFFQASLDLPAMFFWVLQSEQPELYEERSYFQIIGAMFKPAIGPSTKDSKSMRVSVSDIRHAMNIAGRLWRSHVIHLFRHQKPYRLGYPSPAASPASQEPMNTYEHGMLQAYFLRPHWHQLLPYFPPRSLTYLTCTSSYGHTQNVNDVVLGQIGNISTEALQASKAKSLGPPENRSRSAHVLLM
jgi:hypothetical protein